MSDVIERLEGERYDRTYWGPGPWDGEPDRVAWIHRATGLPCLARRGPHGSWCGYVAVPPGHPFHGAGYDEPPVDVHGGLTFANECDEHTGTGICHVPRPGESGDVWWFGFDTAHAGDLCPTMEATYRKIEAETGQPYPRRVRDWEKYRTLAYVRDQIRKLAEQLGRLGASEQDVAD